MSSSLSLSEIDPVAVSMSADSLVVSPCSSLDLDATNVLVTVTGTAVLAGLTVMIDLDPDTPSDDLVARGPISARMRAMLHRSGSGVKILGPGLVRLDMVDAMWTIDLDRCRLFRSDKAIEACFVADDQWIPIRALWVNCENVTALDWDGSYLSCDAAWAAQSVEAVASTER